MKKTLMVWLATLTAVFLIGCSTTSTIKAHPDYSDNAPVISTIDKTETISVSVSGKAEDKEEIDLLRTELMNQFQQNGFIMTENNPTVAIKVQIVNLKRVSRGERIILGVFAGKVRVNVGVIIVKNNKTISMFNLETEAHGWSFLAPTTDQTITKTAERIIEIITNGTLL
jgi:hypothetical protein